MIPRNARHRAVEKASLGSYKFPLSENLEFGTEAKYYIDEMGFKNIV